MVAFECVENQQSARAVYVFSSVAEEVVAPNIVLVSTSLVLPSAVTRLAPLYLCAMVVQATPLLMGVEGVVFLETSECGR